MNQPLHCYAYPSPLGVITLGIRAGALALLDLPGEARPSVGAEELRTEPPAEDAELLERVGQQLADYFAGRRQHFDLPLAPVGTPFQREVWAELARVPYGQTLSYLQLAQRLGKPAAVRAVAQALGRNPIAIILPCHRIVSAGGGLGGFSAGLETKRRLLQLEGVLAPELF